MRQPLPTVLLRETPAESGRSFGIPADLMVKARGRLGKFVLFQAALFAAVAIVVRFFAVDLEAPPGFRDTVSFLHLVAIAAHGVFYWVTRSPRFGHVTVLNLGLLYEVLLCLTITVADQWINHLRVGFFMDMTFASLIIVVYPLIVPTPPWRTFFSSLAAAATIPGGLVILGSIGMHGTADDYLIACITGVITVAVAVFGSVVIHGIHRAVEEARQLGSYRLEKRLGHGGMGEVWQARHELLARPAAIKLVRPELIGARGGEDVSRILGRFEREAQATAMMRSPHTIALYDFGIEDGTFYYVMELLDGLDLDSLIRNHGPVPAERAIHLLLQICDSLGEAHESNLIHRDIKPANLYVCRYGRQVDFVKVLDFGLVKPAETEETEPLTREQTVGGTPAFMAPEQVLGDRPVDPRTDIYTVGCVGYWLVTGKLVFEGATAMETMLHHARTPPVPPSQRTELDVSGDLEAILMACLRKDPVERPQSADALATMLADHPAAAAWTPELAKRWWDRHLPQVS
jgi:serine/threonine-protein kinase